MNCDYGQGYFYSRPLKVSDYESLIEGIDFSVSEKAEYSDMTEDSRHILIIDDDEEYCRLVEKTFGSKFVFTRIRNMSELKAIIERKDMEYSYEDGGLYYFMDTETWEQIPISADILGDSFKFVKENMVCKILSYKGNVFGVEPPNFVELKVTKTDPGFKGDTATNATKPATLETGAEIKVPLFIDVGEVIQIDTRTGEYMGRA